MTINFQSTRFPNEEIFLQLLKAAKASQRDAVVDWNRGISADYIQLLTDVIQMRQKIWSQLPRSTFDERGIIASERPYIFILAPASYPFIVAAFAVLSIGAAISPMSTETKEADALRSLNMARSSIILADPTHFKRASKIKEYAASQTQNVHIVPITSQNPRPQRLSDLNFDINPSCRIDPAQPSLLIMTSGTTGPSKGVVHSRRLFPLAYSFLSDTDAFLCHRSSTWIAGLTPLISGILRGTQLEIVARDASMIWNRLASGKITVFYSVPAVWSALMDYYRGTICNLAPQYMKLYARGLYNLRVAIASSGYLLPDVRKFWTEEFGKPITAVYAVTELGGMVTSRTMGRYEDDERRIGTPRPGVSLKLSGGDHGEILAKCPTMFLGYLDNPEATESAFDEDGYYKTGDFASWVNNEYVLTGRDSEFIRYYGHKVSMYEVEARVSKLPSVAEAYALAVPVTNNAYTEQRVGILIRPDFSRLGNPNSLCRECNPLTLEALRKELSADLPFHMLPTVMRIIGVKEDVPKTVSDKVIRKEAVKKFFEVGGLKMSPEVERWDKECQVF